MHPPCSPELVRTFTLFIVDTGLSASFSYFSLFLFSFKVFFIQSQILSDSEEDM